MQRDGFVQDILSCCECQGLILDCWCKSTGCQKVLGIGNQSSRHMTIMIFHEVDKLMIHECNIKRKAWDDRKCSASNSCVRSTSILQSSEVSHWRKCLSYLNYWWTVVHNGGMQLEDDCNEWGREKSKKYIAMHLRSFGNREWSHWIYNKNDISEWG